MPRHEHLVRCGGLKSPGGEDRGILVLDRPGRTGNVRLQISDISRRLLVNIPDVLIDLLEVAAYVYAADSAISRGGKVSRHMGEEWRRNFRFLIPVRMPELWSSEPVVSALVDTLSFLSDDDYTFEFHLLADPPPTEAYFEFPESEETAFTPDEVVLFSGGLDSLGGAIEELAGRDRRVALVSHRSASKIASAQKHLVNELRGRFGAGRVLHVPVWANVGPELARESTHRTRSFLFAALGAVTGRLFGKDHIRIYENGVVSLNLPLSPPVVGARATRTTHPQALAGFRQVFSELLGVVFDVTNPFVWRTKAEIIRGVAENGCSDLIRHTRSCTRVHEMTRLHPHCGHCSQCLDRRFAVLAAGQQEEDPAEAYKVDLFLGERPVGPDREIALAFVRSASRIKEMEDAAFFAAYGETSRIVPYFPEWVDTVATRALDLHRRHARDICRVFDEAIAAQAGALREGSLPADCLLTLVVGQSGDLGAYRARAPSVKREQAEPPRKEIRIAIDEQRGRVLFEGWGEIKGVGAELLIALAGPFREAVRKELAPEHFPFTRGSQLVQLTNCNHEETLRRRIFRLRKRLAAAAEKAGDPPPTADDVIENIPWHGYRLNPDRVRIVALSELEAS